MKNQIKTAYTLVELLVCIIIIALVIAAFIPIFTKKIAGNKVSILGISSASTNIKDLFLSYDDLLKEKSGKNYECTENTDSNNIKTMKCKLKNIDASKINILISGAGGGGAGAATFGDSNRQTKHYDAAKSTELIDKHMVDTLVHLFSPGNEGGSALTPIVKADATVYIDECPQESIEITMPDGTKYCATKYNIRPKDITQITNYANFNPITKAFNIEGETAIDITLNQESSTGTPMCNITPEEDGCSITDDYPGCGRTVCNERAAEVMCEALDFGNNNCKDEEGNNVSCKGKWFIADSAVANLYIDTFTRYVCTSSARNYRDGWNVYTAPRCNIVKRGNICYCPQLPWGQVFSSLDKCYCPSGEQYRSVRCVLLKSKAKNQYSVNSGAGGASGSYYPVKTYEKAKECKSTYGEGCYFEFEIISKFANSSPGAAIVRIKNKSNSIRYYWQAINRSKAYSGFYEKTGNTSDSSYNFSKNFFADANHLMYGKASTITDNNCAENSSISSYYFYSYNSCSDKGGLGGNPGTDGTGTGAENTEEFTAAQGGIGGKGHKFNEVEYGTGGDGASILSENPTAEELKGKPAGPGHIVFEYTFLYKGASGGGGGGGAYAMIKDIKVTPNKEYEITIGGGGIGGAENQIGIDGGDTKVDFDGKVYIAHGGQGGKLGKPEDESEGELADQRIAGIGGEGGIVEGTELAASVGGSQNGQKGAKGTIDDDYLAAGGLGGRSGISMSTNIVYTACGGLYFNNSVSCFNQDNHNGLGAEYLNTMEKKPQHIFKEETLGSYGGGGGGGGWKYVEYYGNGSASGVFAGKGGDGQGGYVYIWW